MSEIKLQAVRVHEYGGTEVLKSELLLSKKILSGFGTAFSLKDAHQAHELSQTRHGRGRIILRISE